MWSPLVTDRDERARISTVVREIVNALSGASLDALDVVSHCDQLLLPAFLEEHSNGETDHLARALHAQSRAPQALGLYHGLSRIGWTVAHLSTDANGKELCASIDTLLLQALDGAWQGHYDLISGLVGFGVYALERGTSGHAVAARVVVALKAASEPRTRGIGLHTHPSLLPPDQRATIPNGYWNLGMAHGIAGVIAFCARCVRAGIEVELARELMNGGVEFMLEADPPDRTGRFSAWLADGVRVGERTRLAWCYGDLGASAALLAAAQVDPRWMAEAMSVAKACAQRPRADWVRDAGLCHGAAGIAHTFNRLYQTTREPMLRDAALRWLAITIEMRTDHAYAGFPALKGANSRLHADPTLLTGAAGVALVLSATVTDIEPSWDRLLLLDLERG